EQAAGHLDRLRGRQAAGTVVERVGQPLSQSKPFLPDLRIVAVDQGCSERRLVAVQEERAGSQGTGLLACVQACERGGAVCGVAEECGQHAHASRCLSSNAARRVFEVRPSTRSCSTPSLKRISVGSPRTWNRSPAILFSSALTLVMTASPA